jgi:hypothetical protein
MKMFVPDLSQIFWHFPWFSQNVLAFSMVFPDFLAFSVDFPSCSVVPGGLSQS